MLGMDGEWSSRGICRFFLATNLHKKENSNNPLLLATGY
jgi:hypothetical protein